MRENCLTSAGLYFPFPQGKRWPLFQETPPIQSGSGTPPEHISVSRAHVSQQSREQGKPPTSQQLLEQWAFILALCLQRQRTQQGQVPAQQAERLQVSRCLMYSRFIICSHWSMSLLVWLICVSHRDRESANRSDTDSRARRRSRSYSPIRKRRRDSPSFMEARRITR